MSDLNELIQRAEAALKKEESFRPWFVEADAKAVVDGDRYPLDDRSQLHMAIFFENTPALIRELVDALKEAVASAEEWKGRAEYHKEWSEYHSEKWDEARKLNGRDPNEPR